MDFITGLPMVQGKDCIYVVVDRLTKYAHFFAISAHYSAAQVAELFFREIFKLHGLPKTIISDGHPLYGRILAGAFPAGGDRVDTEHQLPPTDRGANRDS